jgi:hypothetical protein
LAGGHCGRGWRFIFVFCGYVVSARTKNLAACDSIAQTLIIYARF